MRLFTDNEIDSATITPTSENLNYPASNLVDTRLSRKWRATGDEDEGFVAAGSVEEEIFQATTNLVTDPEDLTAAGWTESNSTASLSDLYYDSKRFGKVLSSGVDGRVFEDITFTGNGIKAISVIAKYGDDTITEVALRDITAAAHRLEIEITWATKTIVENTGTAHIVKWIDDETVWLFCFTTAVTAANANHFRLITKTNGSFSYFTAAQAEDLTYPTPYVNGTRVVVHPDETYRMQSQFVIDMIVDPWFTYDVGANRVFLSWYYDATHYFKVYYDFDAPDKIVVEWYDGTAARQLVSSQFDDGSALIDINQRLRLLISIDLTTGDTTGSRFIVIPLGAGAVSEDTAWSGNIDALTSTFPTLGIGHENDLLQADSEYEYVRIYAGTLTGTVASSADATALLAEKNIILDKSYKVDITADYALIAAHNITAGATIKLLGNDYNAWNGTPFEESFVWSADTMNLAFTSAAYPYWKFEIDDVNNPDEIIKIGRPFLGSYYQVEEVFDKSFTEDSFNTDIPRYSMSGQMYSRQGYEGKSYSLNFPYWIDTVKKAVEAIVALVGKRKPFFVMLDEDNLTEMPILYCHITNDIQYPHIVDYKWQATLTLREVK